MNKFNVGDRVVVVNYDPEDNPGDDCWDGTPGVVVRVPQEHSIFYAVAFDTPKTYNYFGEDEVYGDFTAPALFIEDELRPE